MSNEEERLAFEKAYLDFIKENNGCEGSHFDMWLACAAKKDAQLEAVMGPMSAKEREGLFAVGQALIDKDARIAALEGAVVAFVAWLEAEESSPDYGSLTRDTHPEGERIWREWYQRNLRLCDEALRLGRAALQPTILPTSGKWSDAALTDEAR